MDIYAENILDHYKHPHHKVRLPSPAVSYTEVNTSCGDTLTLDLTIEDGIITALGWTGEGCAISQSGMSILADELIGKSLADVDTFTADLMKTMLGVPVGTRRLKCAFLSLHTLKNALHTHRNEPVQGWQETVNGAVHGD